MRNPNIDIWHDPEGVWADAGTGELLGPFSTEREAEVAFAVAMIKPVAYELAQRTDDDNAQGYASDLNLALSALTEQEV